MVYEGNQSFLYGGKGIWGAEFNDTYAFFSCSVDIQVDYNDLERMKIDKPFYLAVLANKNQLQPILDNPHLFDPAFVNAVQLLINHYETIKVEFNQ